MWIKNKTLQKNFLQLIKMGSHKQRVQRKIKKDVKRKLQNKPRPQNATPHTAQTKMDEMMKMMLMMKGGQQQNPNAAQDLLTAKEIIAKQNAEEARKQREAKQRIQQINNEGEAEHMKAKTQQYEAEVKSRRNLIELEKQLHETELKLKEVKNEEEAAKLNAKIKSLQVQYDLELQDLKLRLKAEGLAEEEVEKRHEIETKRGELERKKLELQQKEKEYEIENLDAKTKEIVDELTKTKAKVVEYSKINTRGNQKYKDFIAELDATINTLNKGVLKSMVDISTAKDQIENLQKYTIGNLIGTSRKLNTELKKVLKETKAELNDLTEENEQLNALNKENKHLQRDIESTQLNINLENAYTRKKDGKLQIYIVNSFTGANGGVVTSRKWKNVEDVDWDVDKPLERDIAKELANAEQENQQLQSEKNRHQKRYARNENDVLKIDELNDENKKLTAYNAAMDDEWYDDNLKKIAKARVDAEQNEKLLAAQQASKNAQDKLNEEKWREEALNSESIKATTEQINKEYLNKATYEAQAKALERYLKEHEASQQAQATLNVHKQMLNIFSDTKGIVDAEAMLQVANDKINGIVNAMNAEENYIKNKNETFRTNLSENAPLLDVVRGVFGKHGVNIDSPEWFKNNLTSREQVDAFDNIVGTVYRTYNDEKKEWDNELLENNADIDNYLKILFNSESS